MKEAVQIWHDLLTDEMGAETAELMDEQLRRKGLVFGDRPLCTVLRPRLTGPRELDQLLRWVRVLMGAFNRAHEAAMVDVDLRSQFLLDPWEEEAIHWEPGYRESSPVSRLDAFVFDDTGQFKLTEFNAETPAGAAYNDELVEVFSGLPPMREFEKQYRVYPLPCRHGTLHALLDAWRQFVGRRGVRPHIAIVDWPDLPTRTEFILFQRYFHDQGFSCSILDPRELEYRDGGLWGGGQRIDLIYKRVLLTELVQRCGLDCDMLRAVRDRAVCMVNGPRGKILAKKASLAVLSDEGNAHLFSSSQREAIAAFVPWTRVVEERTTMYNGQSVDLIPFLEDHREWMVLKPNDDYGGVGIILGWEVDAETWSAGIRRALEVPYIAQERVRIPSEPYPSMDGGRVRFADRMQDTAPFVVSGSHMVGSLTRLSTASLLNVTAGGGSTVPTFMVEKR